jgi:hypothetical protein
MSQAEIDKVQAQLDELKAKQARGGGMSTATKVGGAVALGVAGGVASAVASEVAVGAVGATAGAAGANMAAAYAAGSCLCSIQ